MKAVSRKPVMAVTKAEGGGADAASLRKPQTLASEAYRRLRLEIINSQFPRGQKLRTQQLCERYGMGLSPIREALNRLSSDGLVEQADQRGFSLAPLSVANFHELNETRCWVNELALRKAIQNGDRAWEETVVLAYYRMSCLPRYLAGGGESNNNPEWEEAHRAFHTALISACNSRWLLRFCEQLFDAADCYRHYARTTPRRALRKNEHQEIMEAVLARDEDKAVDLLLGQFKRTERLLRERLGR
jgi:DNA-binding GntR family transcriptional regulator